MGGDNNYLELNWCIVARKKCSSSSTRFLKEIQNTFYKINALFNHTFDTNFNPQRTTVVTHLKLIIKDYI